MLVNTFELNARVIHGAYKMVEPDHHKLLLHTLSNASSRPANHWEIRCIRGNLKSAVLLMIVFRVYSVSLNTSYKLNWSIKFYLWCRDILQAICAPNRYTMDFISRSDSWLRIGHQAMILRDWYLVFIIKFQPKIYRT